MILAVLVVMEISAEAKPKPFWGSIGKSLVGLTNKNKGHEGGNPAPNPLANPLALLGREVSDADAQFHKRDDIESVLENSRREAEAKPKPFWGSIGKSLVGLTNKNQGHEGGNAAPNPLANPLALLGREVEDADDQFHKRDNVESASENSRREDEHSRANELYEAFKEYSRSKRTLSEKMEAYLNEQRE